MLPLEPCDERYTEPPYNCATMYDQTIPASGNGNFVTSARQLGPDIYAIFPPTRTPGCQFAIVDRAAK